MYYTILVSHNFTTMKTDIALMGPHALASYHSRALALESYGIDPTTLTRYRAQDRSLAKQSRSKRALMIHTDYDSTISGLSLPMIMEEKPLMTTS